MHLRTVRASRETLSENPNQAQTGPLGSFLGSSSLNTQPHCPESLCEAAVAQQGLVHHNVLKSMLSQGRPADDGLQAHRGPSEPKLRAGMPQTYTGTSMVLQLMLHWGPSAAAPSFSSDPRKEPQKGTPCPLYLSPLCQAHSTPTALGSSPPPQEAYPRTARLFLQRQRNPRRNHDAGKAKRNQSTSKYNVGDCLPTQVA